MYGGNNDDDIWGDSGNDYLNGGSGSDDLWGGTGDDRIDGGDHNDRAWGGDGNDSYIFGLGDDNDSFDGGAGAAWTDSIEIESSAGNYGTDWTVSLTSGSITQQDGNQLLFSDDASGTVTLSDGSELDFDNVEQIHW